MTPSKVEELREALTDYWQGASDPAAIAAAIVSTLGITREMAAYVDQDAKECEDPFLQTAADVLTALLDLAEVPHER